MDDFPKTLKEFGYAFNERGELRCIDPETGKPGDKPFEFQAIKDNMHYNQRRYEALGEIITEHVYELLETTGKLKRHTLSTSDNCPARSNDLETFVFVSDDVFTNKDKLIVLLHGSGVVRAGQWARRLIINDNLSTGTQLPFIEKAISEGYAVVVTNTNDNYRMIHNKKKLIRGSENPVNHLLTVWEQIISKSPAKDVALIAHSYGGVCALELASQMPLSEFRDRVFALAMTDSVHSMQHSSIEPALQLYLCQIGRNWVASGKPLDAPIQSCTDDIERVSAGHTMHEMTSYCSMASIFDYVETKRQRPLTEATNNI